MKITDAKAAVDKEWKKLETIPAWKLEKVKSKKEVILEAQRDKKKVHFATLMDTCHSKNAELETKLQTRNGRVVLRGDIVKDDSGACAVFAELGSSVYHMTAAKVMDVIARVPDYDGQAADAVSAYTQVKLEDAPRFTESIATPSWIGVGWWANTEYAGFTAVLTEDRRERQVPITSLSLWTRKTWCQVHLISEKSAGNLARNVLTQMKVESRVTFRQRRHFFRTSTSSTKRWNFLEVLWSRRSCEISSWRTKRSSTRRSKIWNLQTRM